MTYVNDARYTLRLWSRRPGFVAVAALSLALGVGASTSMFSVINSVQQFELDYADVERLVVVWQTNAERGITRAPPTWEVAAALEEHGRSFESLGFFQAGTDTLTIAGGEHASRIRAQPIDVGIFDVLGIEPLLGRSFAPEDRAHLIKEKEVSAIVISHETWQQRLDGDPEVLGRTIRLDGLPRTVIGVMPEGASIVPWVDDVGLWTANDLSRVPGARWMIPVGRLRPGVTIEQAQAEASGVASRVLEAKGDADAAAWGVHLQPIHEASAGWKPVSGSCWGR